MDRSPSTKVTPPCNDLMPARTLALEFWVGLFMLIGTAAVGYLCVGLAGVELFGSNSYRVVAEFDNVAGLESGASVEIAGVQVGRVAKIEFADPMAHVHLDVRREVQLRDDDVPMIRTKGIIGDRYIKISRGASDTYVEPGTVITDTQSVVDFEDIIGKIIHRMEGGSDDKGESGTES